MSTATEEQTHCIPLRRLAASSSLPQELKILLNQFGNQFWQLDATEIARIFSPINPPPSTLVDVAYSQLEQNPSDWPEDAEDTPFHQRLADSLSDFLNASHLALDMANPPIIERDERWYSRLRFMRLGNGSCATHSRNHGPIKPEAVGGISFRDFTLAIPVKLDKDWPAIVAQAARSAQLLYSMCNMRKFGIIIGFRHTTLELRFLIVHRGGVTASKPLSVVEEGGKKDILRVFLSMLTWRIEEDAGVYTSQIDFSKGFFPSKSSLEREMK